MKEFDEETRLKLLAPLPKSAIKPHPSKTMMLNGQRIPMSVINPIYVTERLNKVFGIGGWSFETELVSSTSFAQKTKKGERDMFRGVVFCKLVLANGSSLSTTASSNNDDEGDALKGAATDGLTKLASWIGVGSYVWKNQSYEQAMSEWKKEWDKLENK